MIGRRRALSLAAAALLFVGAVTQAQSAEHGAPLGLSWGASTEDIKAEGIELKDFPSKDYGASFIATKLSKTLADQSATLLSFGLNDKLWRIVIISRDYSNDPGGNAVVERYSELSASLKEKYGKPNTVQKLGDSIYSQPKYF